MSSVRRTPPWPQLLTFHVGTFLFWAALFVYVPVLSLYAKSAGASLTIVGWVVGAYGITQLVLRIPISVASDRWGHRKPFVLAGALAAAIGCLGLALLADPYAMILSRAILGVGASTWVLFTILFTSYFSAERTTWALGSLNFSAVMALVIASPIGGWLAEELGWTAPFFAGTGLAAASLLFLISLPETRTHSASLPRLTELGRVATSRFLIAVSVVGLFDQFLHFTTVYSFTPIHAASLGASKVHLGALVTITLLPRAVATFAASSLVSRVGEKGILVLGLMIASISALVTPQTQSFVALAVSQMFLGAGIGLTYPTLMGLSIRAVPGPQRGTAMGIYQAIYASGIALGPILSGAVADRAGVPSAFYLAGIPCLISALGVGFFLKIPPKAEMGPSEIADREVSCPDR